MTERSSTHWLVVCSLCAIFMATACGTTRSADGSSRAIGEPDATALRASLVERVAAFEHAFKSGDWPVVTGVVSPRLQSSLAARAGISVDQLQAMITTRTGEMMKRVTLHDYQMTIPEAAPTPLANGLYFQRLPTSTDMSIDGTRSRHRSTTLAIYEGGTWSLNRIASEDQIDLIRGVYPELKDIEIK